jgi:predicted phosphodiesterase
MAQRVGDKIVNFKAMFKAATAHEDAISDAARKRAEEFGSPWQVAAIMGRIGDALNAMEKAEQEDGGPTVLTSPGNELAARMQATLAEHGTAFEPLPAGGEELKFDSITDWYGWAWSWLSEWNDAHHKIVPPPSADPEPIKNDLRIALASDWGTGLYGAPVIAKDIATKCGEFDIVAHLGDVYYAGAEKEMQQRFLDAWPRCPGIINRALNGNHEMYSGGTPYFEQTLPKFGQKSSYFAWQNDHWLIVALDTACLDFNLDDVQVKWFERLVSKSGDRRVLVLSHHQLFSQLDSQGPNLADKLGTLLHENAIDVWYWGHEHRCVLYDKQEASGLVARCIGHGGMPQRRGAEKEAPVDLEKCGVTWRKLPAKLGVPSAVILDGPNHFIKGDEKTYSPHGYVTLRFAGKALHESYVTPDGCVSREGDL